MTEKKRTVGITIAALLVMASGFMGLSSSIPPKATIGIFIKPFGLVFFSLIILLSFAEIILSASILRLKEAARASLIAVMLANIMVVLFTPFFYTPAYVQSQASVLKNELDKTKFMQDNRIAQVKARFEEKIKGYPPQEQERMREVFDHSLSDLPQTMLRMSMFLAGLAAFIWYVGVIFFFTRAAVVAQFV